jgi:hypothetical protein
VCKKRSRIETMTKDNNSSCPLSIVDHVGLRRVFVALQPLFKVPSRNTIKKEVLKVYDFEKTCAMKMLDSHEGRVAITTDMWTASNKKKRVYGGYGSLY